MKIGLVGMPASGKSTVFGALTGMAVETGYAAASGKANLGVVKVPDPRVDALAGLYSPKKTIYAETSFSDLAATGATQGVDRATLNAMRDVDALCQVLRAFPNELGEAADPLAEVVDLETETILADLEIVEQRIARLQRDRSDPRELELQQRIQAHLEGEQPVRSLGLSDSEEKVIAGYAFLTGKPLLLVLNVPEDAITSPVPEDLGAAAAQRGLGLVVLSAPVEMDIAQMAAEDQREFLESLGLDEPASHRFIRSAYALLDLISMLTAGEDECRAWPVRRSLRAPQAAGKIHSDIERGFIRAEVIWWEDLIELGSEAKCREAGKLRVEGKEYVIQDGDVVHFRFNV
jgi:GTP-binding protein YchF